MPAPRNSHILSKASQVLKSDVVISFVPNGSDKPKNRCYYDISTPLTDEDLAKLTGGIQKIKEEYELVNLTIDCIGFKSKETDLLATAIRNIIPLGEHVGF